MASAYRIGPEVRFAGLRILVAELGETPTKGAVPIIVNTFIVWRIAEPLAFFNAVGTVSDAESKTAQPDKRHTRTRLSAGMNSPSWSTATRRK